MTDIERRFIGNMTEEDIHSRQDYDDPSKQAPSLIDQWQEQGIAYEIGEPETTPKMSSEKLQAMGYVGVTLLIPKTK